MERIYGLIGRKLGHSYSVSIHNMLGNNNYRLFELEPSALDDFLSDPCVFGLNVTIPYKVEVMKYCDFISPDAAEIGCVNTIVRQSDGKLAGFNTDKYGFEYMLRKAGIDLSGKKVLILGSGGTSLTAYAAAKALDAAEIINISRSGENNYSSLDRHSDAEIIINTTPVGMYPDTLKSLIDLDMFPKCSGIADVVYNPHRTAFIMDAEKRGIPYTDGLIMLTAQAKYAEELFFSTSIADSEIDRVYAHLRQSTQNIILTGMPGCGKTSIGSALAEISGRKCIDIDAAVEENTGKTIPEIFSLYGEEKFRALEHEEICRIGKESGLIIMTGGGVVINPDNYPPLHQNGKIYYIKRDITMLDTKNRPLSVGGISALEKLYEQRLPLYMDFADVEIDNNASIDEAANRIWSDFCENSCN